MFFFISYHYLISASEYVTHGPWSCLAVKLHAPAKPNIKLSDHTHLAAASLLQMPTILSYIESVDVK